MDPGIPVGRPYPPCPSIPRLSVSSVVRYDFRQPNTRAGKNSNVFTSANTAPVVIPISRKGSDNTQTTGNSNNTSSARGQHRKSRMHQTTNRISAFITILDSKEFG